ncbi:hypothetical protein P3T43_001558 [Paraburkholderia sp. GAS41]|jgi:hypothetical protein
MTEQIAIKRRQFVTSAALSLAAGALAQFGPSYAQASEATSDRIPAIIPGSHTTFGALKQIDAES